MLEAALGWPGLAVLGTVALLGFVTDMLRERAVGDDGTTTPPSGWRSFVGLLVVVLLVVGVVLTTVRFDEMT